jgi:membrane protease YdiL (CAAX protease family)
MLRLEVVSGSNVVAGVLAAVAFTLGHVPFQSPLMLATAALLSVLYVRAYQRDRNLLALCVSHAMVGASLMLVRNSLVPF